MSTTNNVKILLRRGLRKDVSADTLETGELGFTNDTNQLFVGIDDAVNEIQFDPFANAQAVIQSWLNSADNPEPGLTVDEDLVIRNVTDINAVLGAMHYFTQTLVFDGQVNFNLGETLCQYKEATPAPNQTWEKFAEGEILTSTIDTVNNTTTVTAKVSEQSEYAPSGFYSETVSDEDEYYFSTTTTGTIEPVKATSESGTNEFIASLFGRARKNVEVVTEITFNQMFTDQHLQALDTSTGLRSSLYKKELSGTTGTFLSYDKNICTTFFIDYSLKQVGSTSTFVRVGTIKVINGVPQGITQVKLTDDNTEIWQDINTNNTADVDEFSNIEFTSAIDGDNVKFNYTQDAGFTTEISYTVKRWTM